MENVERHRIAKLWAMPKGKAILNEGIFPVNSFTLSRGRGKGFCEIKKGVHAENIAR
jgi:hypothetical protein